MVEPKDIFFKTCALRFACFGPFLLPSGHEGGSPLVDPIPPLPQSVLFRVSPRDPSPSPGRRGCCRVAARRHGALSSQANDTKHPTSRRTCAAARDTNTPKKERTLERSQARRSCGLCFLRVLIFLVGGNQKGRPPTNQKRRASLAGLSSNFPFASF